MLILGMDTCNEIIHVALTEDDRLLSDRRGTAPRKQLTWLMPSIDGILRESHKSIKDINLIAVTTGPGSFTGIRLGLTTARTLAQVNNIPIIGVNTIQALAETCPGSGLIIPSMDARKEEIFFAVFRRRGAELEMTQGYQKKSIDDYFSFIKDFITSQGDMTLKSHTSEKEKSGTDKPQSVIKTGDSLNSIWITGSVLFKFKERLEELKDFILFPHEIYWTPRAETIAKIGLKLFKEGKISDYKEILPDYMRNTVATPVRSEMGGQRSEGISRIGLSN